MARWSRYLATVGHTVERGVDAGRHRLKRGRRRDPLLVFPYLTYGTRERLLVMGRVLEDKGLEGAREDASLWENLKSAYKRFESDEVPGAEVRVTLPGAPEVDTVTVTDGEGYFRCWLEPEAPLPDRLEHELAFELLSPLPSGQQGVHFRGEAITPTSGARFGVISDVDDTVLVTGATSLRSMAKKVLFGNARTRLPFEGVAGFYGALHDGVNPLFYVSSSPWNLYDVLVEFMELNDIPLGPLMLRDWGISAEELLPTSHGTHKHEAIETILETYPELPFVLIGDSGQEDPEIYRQVVERHPEQVRVVYIRDVSNDAYRRETIRALGEEVASHGAELVLAATTLEAAEHAAANGWVRPEAVEGVRRSKAEDEAKPPQ